MAFRTRPRLLAVTALGVCLALAGGFVAWSLSENRRLLRVEALAQSFHADLRPDPENPAHLGDMTCRILTWRYAKTHWYDVSDPIIPGIIADHAAQGCAPEILETIRQTHAKLRAMK